MIIFRWIKGLFTFRPERLLGATVGVALTIALLASLGVFLVTSSETMTARAISNVPIDWQVQLSSNTDESVVKDAVIRTKSFKLLDKVRYADVAGLSSDTGGTVQTTGPGKVLGISPDYRVSFPQVIRQLTGSGQGILVAQQTAANLHVKNGDTVTIKRIGVPPVRIKVDGVVDLPWADSLFQAIGVPPGTAPKAPPDNVLIIPDNEWHRIFDAQAKVRPDTIRLQFHVRLENKNLPTHPSAAYTYVTQLANNLEARTAGRGIVGNNLAARLAAVRADALYAQVLFLFLGLPGALLATLLTLSIAASGKKHLIQEQALLRVRGASIHQVVKYEAAEALIVGVGGIILGVLLTYTVVKLLVPTAVLVNRITLFWMAGVSGAGFILAISVIVFPAWKQAKQVTVAASRALVRAPGKPLWEKLYLDLIILGISAFVYWRTVQTGYQVVLAPEGVPQVSVHYGTFSAPFCLWLGGALFARRIWENGIGRGRKMLSKLLKLVANNLSGVVAASLVRQRVLITRGVLLVTLAVAFAVSTAIFNTTYNAQSRTDAELTNGADVTVMGSTDSPPGSKLAEIMTLPGVDAAQPMIHRFTYVGNDLQDIYGIDPTRIGEATKMSDAYFAGGNADASLALLAKHPNGVLVSEETRQDFQLNPGDQINLRLQFSNDHQYHVVPFSFLGVVREFPTAPKDSFLVANAGYMAKETGSNADEIVLIKASGNIAQLTEKVKRVVSSLPGVKVTDIGSTQKIISSSLTSVDLHGLTRLELVFAVILVMGATGLILALGLNERRRNFAILDALGAKSDQLGAFIWSEGLLILLGGIFFGTPLGWGVAEVLVKVLKGVFDPPPEHLVVPWGYMVILILTSVSATVGAVMGMKMISHRPIVEELRNL
jgi:putative ABC transport system permease protein